jgi:hypothetical protein
VVVADVVPAERLESPPQAATESGTSARIRRRRIGDEGSGELC